MNKIEILPKAAVFCLKLKTGETLFSEVINDPNFIRDDILVLKEPFSISYIRDENKEIMTGTPWCPFANNALVPILLNMTFYIDRLNPKFLRFYGSILMQNKISEIKNEVYENMQDKNDYYMMMEGIERIKAVSTEISEKFGLPNEIDTKDFEERAEKFKPAFH